MDRFFLLHDQLPREGPGDRPSLDRALDLVGLREVLDAGEREIANWRAARRETGYLLVVARPVRLDRSERSEG